ncbi:hypothetical protein AcW1_006433 [Taiwanofungus camphoratus]|nr:hypothetical protein AcW1_006433 [Antrodia cinnamomea]
MTVAHWKWPSAAHYHFLFHSIVICIRSADQYTLLDRPLDATLYIALVKFICPSPTKQPRNTLGWIWSKMTQLIIKTLSYKVLFTAALELDLQDIVPNNTHCLFRLLRTYPKLTQVCGCKSFMRPIWSSDQLVRMADPDAGTRGGEGGQCQATLDCVYGPILTATGYYTYKRSLLINLIKNSTRRC